MSKCFPVIILVFLLASLAQGGCAKKERPAIRIGEIEVTKSEFETVFKASRFANYPGESGRKAFLDNFISKKLILKEAENRGLDKGPQFLESIQGFWEQGLLKLILEEKAKELAVAVEISEEEISDYYRRYQTTDFAGKELPEVAGEIKWILLKGKQSKAMLDWVDFLRKKTPIEMDKTLLGITDY